MLLVVYCLSSVLCTVFFMVTLFHVTDAAEATDGSFVGKYTTPEGLTVSAAVLLAVVVNIF